MCRARIEWVILMSLLHNTALPDILRCRGETYALPHTLPHPLPHPFPHPLPDVLRCRGGTYALSASLDQPADLCLPCPDGASCSGGAVLVPLSGMWHSSAGSEEIHSVGGIGDSAFSHSMTPHNLCCVTKMAQAI